MVQGATEDDLILGAITYQSPSQCTVTGQGTGQLDVNLYLDGTPIGAFTLAPSPPVASMTFGTAFNVPASAAETPHTLTAKLTSTCTSLSR